MIENYGAENELMMQDRNGCSEAYQSRGKEKTRPLRDWGVGLIIVF